jgi:ABC-type spermidine/putrescine transport system permease subunit I
MPANPLEQQMTQMDQMINQAMGESAKMMSQYNTVLIETKMIFMLSLLILPMIFFLVVSFIEYRKRLALLQRDTIKKFRSKITDYSKIAPVQRKAQEDIWISEIDVNDIYGKLVIASLPRGLKWAGSILVIEVIIRLLI